MQHYHHAFHLLLDENEVLSADLLCLVSPHYVLAHIRVYNRLFALLSQSPDALQTRSRETVN